MDFSQFKAQFSIRLDPQQEAAVQETEGPVLLRKEVPSVLEAIPIFEAVYRRRGTVFSGFSDLSDAMAQHSL